MVEVLSLCCAVLVCLHRVVPVLLSRGGQRQPYSSRVALKDTGSGAAGIVESLSDFSL